MTYLNIAEAVPLGYALVARVASDAGVRALCIKGPITSELGLRPVSHVSQDVDLLVDPNDAQTLAVALVRSGWRAVPPSAAGKIVAPHSEQFTHAHFGLELDLHVRFPGFFVDPQRVFDLLWARRREVGFAEIPCPAVDSDAALAIEILHLARDPDAQWPRLRRALAAPRLSAPEFQALVIQLGAAPVMSQWLPSLPTGDEMSPEIQRWTVRASVGRTTSTGALFELRSTRGCRERVRLVWRLAFMPRQELMRKYPELRDAPLGVLRACLRRWLSGAVAMPEAIRRLARAKSLGGGPQSP